MDRPPEDIDASSARASLGVACYEAVKGDKDPEQAATLLGAAEQLFRAVGAAIDPDETQEKVLAFAVERLGTERVDELRAAGAARPLDKLIAG
jgi:hypothetical protein